jgi:hypothetical protein
MPRRPAPSLAQLALLLIGIGASGCPGQRGEIPMAGSRYPSTACIFGLRGVRVAVDDCDTDVGSLDVTLTMSADIDELRRRAHVLLENAASDAGVSRPEPLRTPARSVVEDIPNGVKVHVTPLSPHDLDALRDEIEDRVERASDSSQCP